MPTAWEELFVVSLRAVALVVFAISIGGGILRRGGVCYILRRGENKNCKNNIYLWNYKKAVSFYKTGKMVGLIII